MRSRRLERSYLAARAGVAELVTVAHDLCGVHAQVQSSAELQLAVRVDGLTGPTFATRSGSSVRS